MMHPSYQCSGLAHRSRRRSRRGVALPLSAAFLLLSCIAEAQTPGMLLPASSPAPPAASRSRRPLTSIGVTGAALYAAGVGTLTTEPCDCAYKSGSGVGYDAGLLVELPVSRSMALMLRLGYMAHSTLYTSPRRMKAFSSEGEEFQLEVEDRATADLQYAGAGAQLRVYLGTGRLYLGAGPSLGYMTRGTLKTEEWIRSAGYVYPGTRSPVLRFPDVDLTGISPAPWVMSMDVAAGMPLLIARGTILEPELSLALPLTRVAKGYDEWSVLTVRLGVSLRFGW
jgi:hypothetical protein